MKLVRNDVKFIPNVNEFSFARDNKFKELFDDALADKDILLSDIVVSEQNNTFIVDLHVYYRTDAVLLYKRGYRNKLSFKRNFIESLNSFKKLEKKNRLQIFKRIFRFKGKFIKRVVISLKKSYNIRKKVSPKRLVLKKLIGKNFLHNLLLERQFDMHKPTLEKYFEYSSKRFIKWKKDLKQKKKDLREKRRLRIAKELEELAKISEIIEKIRAKRKGKRDALNFQPKKQKINSYYFINRYDPYFLIKRVKNKTLRSKLTSLIRKMLQARKNKRIKKFQVLRIVKKGPSNYKKIITVKRKLGFSKQKIKSNFSKVNKAPVLPRVVKVNKAIKVPKMAKAIKAVKSKEVKGKTKVKLTELSNFNTKKLLWNKFLSLGKQNKIRLSEFIAIKNVLYQKIGKHCSLDDTIKWHANRDRLFNNKFRKTLLKIDYTKFLKFRNKRLIRRFIKNKLLSRSLFLCKTNVKYFRKLNLSLYYKNFILKLIQLRSYKLHNKFFKKKLVKLKKKSNKLKILKKKIKYSLEAKDNKYKMFKRNKILEREKFYDYVKRFLLATFINKNSETKDLKFRIIALNYLAEPGFTYRIFKIVDSFNTIFRKLHVIKLDFAKITALVLNNKISAKAFVRQLGKLFENMHKSQHGIFFKFVSVLLTEFRAMLLLDLIHNKNNIQIVGIKIVIAGRLKGKTRAKYQIFQVGSLRQTTFSIDIKFSRHAVHTGYGVYGIHTWITYKNTSDLTISGHATLLGGFKIGQVKNVQNYLGYIDTKLKKDKLKKEKKEKLLKLQQKLREKQRERQKKIQIIKLERKKKKQWLYKNKFNKNKFNKNKGSFTFNSSKNYQMKVNFVPKHYQIKVNSVPKQASYAPPGSNYKGKNYDPNFAARKRLQYVNSKPIHGFTPNNLGNTPNISNPNPNYKGKNYDPNYKAKQKAKGWKKGGHNKK